MLELIKWSVREFMDDDCTTMAAALSYYTVFSLPPLLVLILLLVGAVMDPQDVQGSLEGNLQSLMGPRAGQTIRTILEHAQLPGPRGLIATVIGVGALILGAAGVFGQLQVALNRTWGVKPDPAQGGIKSFVRETGVHLRDDPRARLPPPRVPHPEHGARGLRRRPGALAPGGFLRHASAGDQLRHLVRGDRPSVRGDVPACCPTPGSAGATSGSAPP